jgi:hypothetical protein
MTDADRLLLAALEDMHPGQFAPLLRIAEQKGITVGEAVVMAMRLYLASKTPQERAEAIAVFKRDGIELEELL